MTELLAKPVTFARSGKTAPNVFLKVPSLVLGELR
jgi:hypothetical protein